MIAEDSPLRRLPVSLNPRQTLFLDGIRHAAELADYAYDRLAETLTRLALAHSEGAQPRGLYTEPFLDAWAVVDAIDRLRGLAHLAPGLEPRPRSDGRPGFREATQGIRDLRNVSDHLGQRVDYVLAKDGAALGKLSWLTLKDERTVLSCAIVPGTVRSGTAPLINPLGKTIVGRTGAISLLAGEHTVDLSAAMETVREWIGDLEQELGSWLKRNQLEGSQAGADLMAVVAMTWHARGDDAPPA